jgi:hypothetical protein
MNRSDIVIITALLAISAQPAMAYIDPGSGSAIISALIGFFVAASLAVKTYWYKLKGLVTGKKDNSKQTEEAKE